MTFPKALGTITCRCVMEKSKPVLFVSHAGGDWQMYSHYNNHDFESQEAMEKDLFVVHVAHLLACDPTLELLADLPVDMGAERKAVGSEWTWFVDSDDD